MNIAPAQANEQERLKALGEYFILDTLPEDDFDDITSIASEVCNTPISFVSIIDADRQWFKSQYGLQISETSRENSFCSYATNGNGEVCIIPDLRKDDRFNNNPLVTGDPFAVFYAGVPLINPEGFTLGALCVLDTKPRDFTANQVKVLQALARQIVSLLELRKKTILLKQRQTELSQAHDDIERIAHIASHDLKSPLNNIISLAHLLKDDYGQKLSEEGNEYLTFLNEASYQLSDLISGIVTYMRSSQLEHEHKELINVTELIEEAAGSLNTSKVASVRYKRSNCTINAPRAVIKQILLQLMQNAVLHNHSSDIKIEVKFHENKNAYTFEIKDNGPGIAEEDKLKIFDLFERLQKKKDGESMGIGLAIVKRLIEKTGGEIRLDTELNKGSSFVFTVPK